MRAMAVTAKKLDVTIGDVVEIAGRRYDVVSDKGGRNSSLDSGRSPCSAWISAIVLVMAGSSVTRELLFDDEG